jgi:hypothetical protein
LILQVAVDLNSPGFFKLVAQGSWPPGEQALGIFLELDSEDVQAIVKLTLRRSPKGRTWEGLWRLMEHKGYLHVRDMGEDAAVSWARHLGVTEQAETEINFAEPSVGA